MKKVMILLGAAAILAVFVAFESGCGAQAAAGTASLSQEKYNQISTGMSGDQVKQIAGDPSRTETKTLSQMPGMVMSGDMTVDYWYYQGSKGWVRFEISDGHVSGKTGY